MILLRPGAALCLALLLGCDNRERPSVDVKELMRETLDAWESRSIVNVAPHYSHTPGRLFFDPGPLKYPAAA